MNIKDFKHVHFIGIGGIGMSGIAQILSAMGVRVSGSDLRESAMTRRLAAMCIRTCIGHAAENIAGADLVVYSSAVSKDNPEMRAALDNGVTVWMRAQMLGAILEQFQSIVIAGTHGKTSITSSTATILERAGLSPTSIIGGELNDIGGNAKLGSGPHAVAEGDESDGSFTFLRPNIALVNNVDADHLDYFHGIEDVQRQFAAFLDGVDEDGAIFLSADCKRAPQLAHNRSQTVVRYGLEPNADYTARNVEPVGAKLCFDLVEYGRLLGRIELRLAGMHNIHNCLGAIGIARRLGVSFEVIAAALADFRGPRRRFELVGERSGVTVIDDYAHHPTEITATLAAFAQRYPGRRIGVFQPHRYSRTSMLLPDFARSFGDLDTVILTDVYAAGEAPIEGATGRSLYETVRRHARHTVYVDSLEGVSSCVLGMIQPGDAVITMGAGDVWKVSQAVFQGLESERP